MAFKMGQKRHGGTEIENGPQIIPCISIIYEH